MKCLGLSNREFGDSHLIKISFTAQVDKILLGDLSKAKRLARIASL